MSVQSDIKILLSGTLDEKITVIEERTSQRLLVMLGVEEMPKELESIIYEVTLKRLNRIGNEGMSSYSQEGLPISFPDSDFDEYAQLIKDWKYRQKEIEDENLGKFLLL